MGILIRFRSETTGKMAWTALRLIKYKVNYWVLQVNF